MIINLSALNLKEYLSFLNRFEAFGTNINVYYKNKKIERII